MYKYSRKKRSIYKRSVQLAQEKLLELTSQMERYITAFILQTLGQKAE